MKRILSILCIALTAMGLMQAKTITGSFAWQKIANQGSFRFTQTSIPVTITIDESAKTVSIDNMFGYRGMPLTGTYTQSGESVKFTFSNGQKVAYDPSGQDKYGLYTAYESSYGATYYINNVADIKATLASDGKSLAFSKDLGLLNMIMGGSQATVFFGGCSIALDTQLFSDPHDIDIHIDNQTTGIVKFSDEAGITREKVVAVQKAFFNGEGYEGMLRPYEPAAVAKEYVVNPCQSKTAATFTGLDDATKAAMQAAGYDTDWITDNTTWRGFGYEVSLNTTDDFQAELARWTSEQSVMITRTAPNMNDATDIGKSWIVPNASALRAGWELYDEREVEQGVKAKCGLHFKDVIPVSTALSSFDVDYVIYWYGKVKSDMVSQIPQGGTRNSSFVQIGGEWYYYALPNSNDIYVATSQLNYKAGTSGEPTYSTPAGFHLNAHFEVDNVSTGLDQNVAGKQVASIRYYNLQGMESNTPFKGFNLMRVVYSDGSGKVTKIFR